MSNNIQRVTTPHTADLPSTSGRRGHPKQLTRIPPRLSVLIVEDQFMNAEHLRIWIEELGHDVCGIARTAEDAVKLANLHEPDLLFMDYLLEGHGDGVDAVLAIRKTLNPSIVFVTASADERSVKRIMSVRPLRVLPKPADPRELHEIVNVVGMMKWTMGAD